jgi:hypothetical protein
VIQDLSTRLDHPGQTSAVAKLNAGILGETGAKHPFELKAAQFNRASETYYRQTLLKQHIAEAWQVLDGDMAQRDFRKALIETGLADQISQELGVENPEQLLAKAKAGLNDNGLSSFEIMALINLVLLSIQVSGARAGHAINQPQAGDGNLGHQPSIYHAAQR